MFPSASACCLLLQATKVAVLGAAGGIGQPLSLLLKLNDRISSLSLFDLVNTPGVGADIGHINTRAKVTGFKGKENLAAALEGADRPLPSQAPRGSGNEPDPTHRTDLPINSALGAPTSGAASATVKVVADIGSSPAGVCERRYCIIDTIIPASFPRVTSRSALRGLRT